MSNHDGGPLSTFERNHFFYGMLMDVEAFSKDQTYFNRRRQLLNRLTLGHGVVCGLDAVIEDTGGVRIEPGVAIDGWGHMIVVPNSIPCDPRQPTDENGEALGERMESGSVEIRLAYVESCVDHVPVLVPTCDTPGNCAPSTIREEFRVLVREVSDAQPEPPTCGLVEFRLPADGALHELLCDHLSAACPVPAVDPSVPLARVTLEGNGNVDRTCRPLVYSNARLYELLLCLAGRIERIAQGRFLRYVSGDGQTGKAEEQLPEPLVVEIVDGEGEIPRERVHVTFTVSSGGGHLKPQRTSTNLDDGRAETRWTLGRDSDVQEVTATAEGTPFTVKFSATVI